MQTAFTSLGCGSVNYMAIEDGDYINMASKTTMNDKYEFSQGLFCQIDENGNLRITRMDFYNKTTVGECWELPYPTADGAHLTLYGKDRGSAEKNRAPELSRAHAVSDSPDGDGKRATVIEFAAAKDDTFAHHYTLELKNAATGETVKTFRILSDFYRVSFPSQMKPVLSCEIGPLAPGEYEAILVAYDSWSAASAPLAFRFVV